MPKFILLSKCFATIFMFAITASLVGVGSVVLAQSSDSGITLVAIPPRLGEDLDFTAKPGETKQEQIRVRNASSQPVTIRSQAIDFILDEDGETPIAVDESVDNRWSLASWVTVAPGSQTLAPNQTATLSLVIEVPEDALPGGHYAMIAHQPTNSQAEVVDGEIVITDSVTGITQQVGTLIYLTVEGPINEQAFIRNLTFPQFSEFGPVPYSFSIENNSDVHIRPQISLSIANLFGKVVEEMPIEAKNVFPLTSRDFSGSWEQIWGTGLYKATVTMAYGSQGQVASDTVSFWLLPIKLIIAIIVVILTIIAAIIVIRRHWLHRTQDQQKKIQELEKQVSELNAKDQSHE